MTRCPNCDLLLSGSDLRCPEAEPGYWKCDRRVHVGCDSLLAHKNCGWCEKMKDPKILANMEKI